MDHYFDREGRPITLLRWAELFEDRAYRFVADEIVNGYRVATIWTGFDPYLYDTTTRAPEIFETTIFRPASTMEFETAVFVTNKFEAVDQAQYTTEENARAGHAACVQHVLSVTGLGLA